MRYRGPAQSRPAAQGKKRPAARPGAAYLQRIKSLEETPYLTKVVLRNGLTALVHEFRPLPVANITTFIRGGNHGESETSRGFSRILARLFFRASLTKAPGVIAREVRAMGGLQGNAALDDGLVHDLVVPSGQWKKALEIQADALLHPAPDPDLFRRELQAMSRRDGGDLGDGAQDELMRIAFGRRGGGFALPEVRGSDQAPTRESLLEFYREACHPAGLSWSFRARSMRPRCSTRSCACTTSPFRRRQGRCPSRRGRRRMNSASAPSAARGGNAVLLAGFHAVPAASPDFAALEVLRVMLGEGEESLLCRRLRDNKKLILSGSALLFACREAGYLLLRLEIEPESLDPCEIALMTVLEMLRQASPDEEDVQRAKAQLETEWWSRRQTVTGRAHMIAGFEALGDWKMQDQVLPRIREVKASDIARVAGRYLSLNNCSLVEALPAGTPNRNMTADTLRATLQALLPASVGQESVEREKETKPAVDLKGGAEAFKYSEVRYPMRKASILRGPELYIQEDHTLPLMHLAVFYPGGRLLETESNCGITSLLLRSLLLSSRGGETARIRRQLEIYGASVRPFVGEDYFGLLVTVSSRNVELALELLARLLQLPDLEKEDLVWLKKLHRVSSSGCPSGLCAAFEAANRALFAGHPYALPADGTAQSVASVTAGDLAAWHKATMLNRKPYVFMIGDTQGTSLAGFFVRRFSGARFQEVKLPEAYAKPGEKPVSLELKSEGSWSASVVALPAPPAGDEDALVMRVVEAHLSGPGGQLADSLRERLGLADESGSAYLSRARGGAVLVYATSGRGAEDKLTEALQEEMRGLSSRPLLYRDYRSALNSAIGWHWIGQQNRCARMLSLATGIIAGMPLEEILDFPVRLQDVSEEGVADMIRRVFNQEKSVIMRVRANPPLP